MKTSASLLLICWLSLFLGLFLILETAEANQHNLCACSLPTRCETGKGCIVKKGECNTESCPFPRLFMCDMMHVQDDHTVTCGVMGNGWSICLESPEYTTSGTNRVMKPRPIMVVDE